MLPLEGDTLVEGILVGLGNGYLVGFDIGFLVGFDVGAKLFFFSNCQKKNCQKKGVIQQFDLVQPFNFLAGLVKLVYHTFLFNNHE